VHALNNLNMRLSGNDAALLVSHGVMNAFIEEEYLRTSPNLAAAEQSKEISSRQTRYELASMADYNNRHQHKGFAPLAVADGKKIGDKLALGTQGMEDEQCRASIEAAQAVALTFEFKTSEAPAMHTVTIDRTPHGQYRMWDSRIEHAGKPVDLKGNSMCEAIMDLHQKYGVRDTLQILFPVLAEQLQQDHVKLATGNEAQPPVEPRSVQPPGKRHTTMLNDLTIALCGNGSSLRVSDEAWNKFVQQGKFSDGVQAVLEFGDGDPQRPRLAQMEVEFSDRGAFAVGRWVPEPLKAIDDVAAVALPFDTKQKEFESALIVRKGPEIWLRSERSDKPLRAKTMSAAVSEAAARLRLPGFCVTVVYPLPSESGRTVAGPDMAGLGAAVAQPQPLAIDALPTGDKQSVPQAPAGIEPLKLFKASDLMPQQSVQLGLGMTPQLTPDSADGSPEWTGREDIEEADVAEEKSEDDRQDTTEQEAFHWCNLV
jgi:hypothetical protein